MRRAWRAACKSHIHSSHSINLFHFFFRLLDVVFVCAWFWVLRAWTKSAKAKQDEIKENKKCIQPAAIQWASQQACHLSYINTHIHIPSIQLAIEMYMNVVAHWHLACLTLFSSIALLSVYILFLILYLMFSLVLLLSRALYVYSYCCLNKQVPLCVFKELYSILSS